MHAPASPRLQPRDRFQAGDVTNCLETTYDLDHDVAWGSTLGLQAPGTDPWEARSITRSAHLSRVSLDRVPDEVDGAWWARHAHLFLDRSSLGRGPGDAVPGEDARELSIPLRAALIEGVANGRLTREVSDGVTQRDITLWLPCFVIVVVASDEVQGFDPSLGPDHAQPVHAERLGSTAERAAAERVAFDPCMAQPFGAHLVRARPGGARGGSARSGLPNVRRGAPNVRRTGLSMLWTP